MRIQLKPISMTPTDDEPKAEATPEIDALRKRCSDLHRRCQQAEAAVEKFRKDWQNHGGPRGGSFGRALLACHCIRLEEEVTQWRDVAGKLAYQLNLLGHSAGDSNTCDVCKIMATFETLK